MNWHELYHQDFLKIRQNSVDVVELAENPTTTIKKISFTFPGTIYEFNAKKLNLNGLLNDGIRLCDDKSLCAICDGIILFKKDDKWFLIICELKSGIGSNTYKKIIAQLEAGLLKSKLFLELVKDFDENNMGLLAFIVTNKNDERILASQRALNVGCPDNFDYNNLMVKKTINKLTDTLMKDLPIKDKFRLIDSKMYLIEGDAQTVNLDTYLS